VVKRGVAYRLFQNEQINLKIFNYLLGVLVEAFVSDYHELYWDGQYEVDAKTVTRSRNIVHVLEMFGGSSPYAFSNTHPNLYIQVHVSSFLDHSAFFFNW
jgi:hypothetical protein